MADIPSPLTWGTVRGNFGALNADSSDAGLVPDLDVVQGTVTLTPRLSLVKILNPSNPMIAIAKTVQCVIKDGVLIGPDGQPTVRVVASDSPGFEPSPLQWDVRIQINGAAMQPPPMIIDVPAGKVVDLALIVPSPPAVPVVTVVTEETKIEAMIAAAEAQASAQAAYGFSVDSRNALADSLAARVDAINAKNASEAALLTAEAAKDTAVSSASSANASKISAEASAATATSKAASAADSALRAEESAKSTLPLNGTTEQFLRGDVTWATLDKSAVGLPNVDNTSDADKPLSSAAAGALGTKRDVLPVALPNAEHNLNDYKTNGTYVQTTSGAASLVRNYPVPSGAGILSVEGTGNHVYQEYKTLVTYPTQIHRVYLRTYWSTQSMWSGWTEQVLTNNIVQTEPVATATFSDRGSYVCLTTVVDTGGRFIPGLVKKHIAGGSNATGANLKPVRADISQIPNPQSMLNTPIKSNSSGWRVPGSLGTTGANLDEIIGLQIRNGVLLHDFDNISDVSLGFLATGESKMYFASQWTGAQVVADGVIDSFSFGRALVVNGVAQNITSTERSGRTILGQRADGTIVLVNVYGVSGSSGALQSELVTYMKDWHNCWNAIALDGGGSAQMMMGSERMQLSSDAAGYRPIPDVLVINARVGATPDTPWTPLPLLPGYTSSETQRAAEYRRVNGEVQLRGRVFGTFPVGTYTNIGTLPNYLISPRSASGTAIGTAAVPAIVTLPPGSTSVQINPQSTISGWVDITSFNYYPL